MKQEAQTIRLRVLIVSDVRVVREGLRSILAEQDEVDVVSTVDMHRAADQTARLHPDVILFDAARQDSVEFLKELVASVPHSKVVAFGIKETDEEILALAAAGTAGYICNSTKSNDVAKVLEQVMCDELPCSPRAAASLYRRVATLSQAGNEPVTVAGAGNHICSVALSRRELQIAHLIDDGLTNKQIGRELGIEPGTVKNHVHNLCEKLEVHRRGEAAARVRAIARDGARFPPLAPASVGPAASAPDANPALEPGGC
jgi:two-component system nitrate/nitrite response regulator NarL